MILKNIHIGNINVSDTYSNVVHINNNINPLYLSTSSMYMMAMDIKYHLVLVTVNVLW